MDALNHHPGPLARSYLHPEQAVLQDVSRTSRTAARVAYACVQRRALPGWVIRRAVEDVVVVEDGLPS